MPRFFFDEISSDKKNITLSGEDSKHISRVLRMKQGDRVIACDGKGIDYDCEIVEPDQLGENVLLKVIGFEQNNAEPNARITLYQCMPKGDKLEFIIQKAVELGVFEIVPVESRFCVAKCLNSDFEKKRLRYQKIAAEAAKQSGRGIIPAVSSAMSFGNALEQAAKADITVLFYENGGIRVSDIFANIDCTSGCVSNISVIVGSEGGFSEDEVQKASSLNINTATLGKLILRCETAPIAGLTLVLHELNML